MTQRERKRLSGFCSQSLAESRLLSPRCPQPTPGSGVFQLSALVSAGAKDQSHKSPKQIAVCQKLGMAAILCLIYCFFLLDSFTRVAFSLK